MGIENDSYYGESELKSDFESLVIIEFAEILVKHLSFACHESISFNLQ